MVDLWVEVIDVDVMDLFFFDDYFMVVSDGFCVFFEDSFLQYEEFDEV